MNEHSLHSPFFFDLYTKVIKEESSPVEQIENLRNKLLEDEREIKVTDYGAGSQHGTNPLRKISDITKYSVSPVKLSLLYQRLARHCKAKTIIELGTSFGINTLYLSRQPNVKVITFEGSESIAEIASLTFEFDGATNIEMVQGNLDSTLYATLSRLPKVDFVVMDANHRYQPTLRYFELLMPKIHHGSIIAIDDIHLNPEMERAWKALKKHDLVYSSIDLYRCGILFFDPSLTKRHVVLQF